MASKPLAKRTVGILAETSWVDAIARFMTSLEHEERSRHTSHHYRDDLRCFAAWWENSNQSKPLSPSAVTEESIRTWKLYLRLEPIDDKGRTRKPASINAKLSALKSFLKWCDRKGVISTRPEFPRAERLAVRTVKWLTDEEQRKLIYRAGRARDPRTLHLVVLLIETGLRVAELVALRWADIELMERKGKLEVRRGKGCKPRTVPLSKKAREALQGLKALDTHEPADPVITSQRTDEGGRRKPRSVRGVEDVFSTLSEECGTPINPHMCRHTFGMNLRRDGTDWPVIAALLGHSSIVTTMTHYGTPSELDRARAVDRNRGEED